MSDEQQSPTNQASTRIRRSSFAGQTFADLFGTGRSSMNRSDNNNASSGNPPPPQYPGPITTAAAQAQQRRMSLTTVGLSGANGQVSPFGSYRGRTESFGSANSSSLDESAIAEDDSGGGPAGSVPITRRTSFGARALRDIRRGSMTGVPGMSPTGQQQQQQQNGTSSPPASMRNSHAPPPQQQQQQQSNGTISSRDIKGREGFNWSDNFRTRAERTSSISGQSGGGSPSSRMPPAAHARAKSVAVMEPVAMEPPISSMPKPRDEIRRPDHFQERILKGDFYMD